MEWLETLLKKAQVYQVGGGVRDELLNRPTQDQDLLVCQISIDALNLLLEKFGTVHLVGKSFGIFKFTDNQTQQTFDIALPRREQSTGEGHRDFAVQVDPQIPLEEDLKRRDFTINAMARSLKDQSLIDPWGGHADLQNKLIRQVFDETFAQDPLRLLRACQFAARFEFDIEEKTLAGMKAQAHLASTVSPERIFAELTKLLKAPKPSIGFRLMHETGLLKVILPELENTVGVAQPEKYHRWPVFEHILAVVDAAPEDNLPVRWAALFHDLGKPDSRGSHPKDGRITFHGHEKISQQMTLEIFERLRAPEALIQKVSALCREHMFAPEKELSDKALRRLIYRVGPEHIEDLILLRKADRIGNGMGVELDEWQHLGDRVHGQLKEKVFSRQDLAISGNTLIKELALDPGPQIGLVLDHLLNQVLGDPQKNNRQQLLEEARDFLQK